MSDFVFLCRELNANFDGNNSIIDQLMNLINENLVIPMARDPQMRQHLKQMGIQEDSLPLNQTDMSIANASVVLNNNSRNQDLNDTAEMATFIPRNLEETLNSMEDSFWYILNNPTCYCSILYKFFNKAAIFKMFPHVEAFWKNAKMAEVAEFATQNAQAKLVDPGLTLLEEIKEEDNEHNQNRDSTYTIVKRPTETMERVESSSIMDESPRTGSSAKGGIHSSTRIVDIPFKPQDILDWV